MDIKSNEKQYVGYTQSIRGKGKTTWLHRLIMQPPTNMVVDHVNCNPLDNRKENLRIITDKVNKQNKKGAASHSLTGIRGVKLNKPNNRFEAQIKLNGKNVYLGSYRTLEEAELVAIESRMRHFPGYIVPTARYEELMKMLRC